MQNFARIFITKKGELHAKGGHPWVFEGEVLKILPPTDCENTSDYTPEDGTLVNVFSRTEEKPCYIGTGFYNSASKIRVRIISTNANERNSRARPLPSIRGRVSSRCDVQRPWGSRCLLVGCSDRYQTAMTCDVVAVCFFHPSERRDSGAVAGRGVPAPVLRPLKRRVFK